MLNIPTKDKAAQTEYADLLRNKFTPEGKRVYVHCNHWTDNGTRYYDVYTVSDDRIERITAFVSHVTGYAYDNKRECIRTQNADNYIVSDLSRALYGTERALVMERLA